MKRTISASTHPPAPASHPCGWPKRQGGGDIFQWCLGNFVSQKPLKIWKGSRDRGQVIVIFAIVLVVVLLMIALAVDGGSLYVQRRGAQAAADAAAFAGAASLASGSPLDQARSAALQRAAANGFDNDGASNWVSAESPPSSGPFANDSNHFQVTIRARIQTAFLQLFLANAAESTSEAVVRFSTARPLAGPNALAALSKTACNALQADLDQDVSVQGGGLFSNSGASGSCAALEKSGAGVLAVSGGGIALVGSYLNTGSGAVSPAPQSGAPQVDLPPIAPPDCSCGANFSGAACAGGDVSVSGGASLSPGIYHNISLDSTAASLVLNPGLYCLTGTLSASAGTLAGSGVILAMAGGGVDLGGGAAISLAAPPANAPLLRGTDGNPHRYAGLLLYGDPAHYAGGGAAGFALGGADGSAYTGTIYAPATACSLAGSAGTLTFNSQVACASLALSGAARIAVNFSPSQNWMLPPLLALEY